MAVQNGDHQNFLDERSVTGCNFIHKPLFCIFVKSRYKSGYLQYEIIIKT